MPDLAATIISKLREAKNAGEIEQIASTYRAEVLKMKGTARFHHIVNAKAYYLKQVTK